MNIWLDTLSICLKCSRDWSIRETKIANYSQVLPFVKISAYTVIVCHIILIMTFFPLCGDSTLAQPTLSTILMGRRNVRMGRPCPTVVTHVFWYISVIENT